MKAKKVYSAPAVEVVPVAMNSVVMWSGKASAANASFYAAFFWDANNVDSEGFNIWSE